MTIIYINTNATLMFVIKPRYCHRAFLFPSLIIENQFYIEILLWPLIKYSISMDNNDNEII